MRKIPFYLLLAALTFVSACKKNSDPSPVPYAAFKVNGVQQTYYNYSRFCKNFCASSTFCGTFDLDDNLLPAELLKVGLPGDPVSGQVFKAGDHNFVFTWVDPNQKWYTINGGSLTLTMTKWEGQGGWGCGNFSGWLKYSSTDSVYLSDGYFQNWIWTYTAEK